MVYDPSQTTKADAAALPTIEELKRIYEQGIEQTLLSGVRVQLRPVLPDRLIMSGDIPDILTALLMKSLYPEEKAGKPVAFPDEVDSFIAQPVSKKTEMSNYMASIDAVCVAALLDPSVLPYLALADRLWIFKLALLPAEVLSRFRIESARDVAALSDQQDAGDATEPVAESDGGILEPSGVPV